MLTYLQMEDNDIFIVNGDFLQVRDYDVLRQNVIRRLMTPKGSVFFSPSFGSNIHEWIKSRDISTSFAQTHIKRVLIACEEIDTATIDVDVQKIREKLLIRCHFRLVGSSLTEKLMIYLKENDVEVRYA